MQVQIAACDTFRSGAVEQLRTHCNRLNIPLFERGYEKDPARVASEAIKAAERSNIDVLLVDTAGELLLCCVMIHKCIFLLMIHKQSGWLITLTASKIGQSICTLHSLHDHSILYNHICTS